MMIFVVVAPWEIDKMTTHERNIKMGFRLDRR